MIGSRLRIVLLGLAGVAAAAALGYSAHVVAGSQIGLPANNLSGVNQLAPADKSGPSSDDDEGRHDRARRSLGRRRRRHHCDRHWTLELGPRPRSRRTPARGSAPAPRERRPHHDGLLRGPPAPASLGTTTAARAAPTTTARGRAAAAPARAGAVRARAAEATRAARTTRAPKGPTTSRSALVGRLHVFEQALEAR